MRTTAFGVVIGACLTVFAIAGLGQHNAACAQRGSVAESGTELMTATAMVGDRIQQLTVIDPRSRVMTASGWVGHGKGNSRHHWRLRHL